MDPVLDSEAFPSILDRIVDVAPYKALLALRLTSRRLSRRVDAILFDTDHLILRGGSEFDREDDTVIVSSPLGRIPSFAAWDRPWDGPQRQIDATFQHVRTVDFVGLQLLQTGRQSRWSTEMVNSVVPSSLTLRYMASAPPIPRDTIPFKCDFATANWHAFQAPGADTLVLFAPLPHLFRHDWTPLLIMPPLGFISMRATEPWIYPRPRRAVINISVNAEDWVETASTCSPGPRLHCPRISGHARYEEAVWIFSLADRPTGMIACRKPDTPLVRSDGSKLLLEVLSVILQELYHGNTTTTVVGPWRAGPRDPGPGRGRSDEGPSDTMGLRSPEDFLALCELCSYWKKHPDADPTRLREIEFLTLEEFESRIGPEQAALELREVSS